MKGRQNSSADMLQRKRQGHTLGSTNSLHLKHSKCGDTTTLQWVEVSCQCASLFWYTLDIGIVYIQHAVGKCTDGIFTGEERKESTLLLTKSQRRNHCLRSFQNPSRQSKVTTAKKGPTDKQTNTNKNTSNPVCSSFKCTKWMVKKKRTRGPSRCPAASTVTFVTDYNLAFHRPNEDQCLLCRLCKWWRNKFIVSGHEG